MLSLGSTTEEQIMIESLRLRNFTVFESATFEFCPQINVIIGENGTGKSQLLRLAYALSACGPLTRMLR